MDYDLEDIGTHSTCKGTTTYASSGTTASPGGISIGIQRKWIMGKVQDIYMLYKKVGDQYTERLLIGLPVMSHLFAASHPQFTYLKSAIDSLVEKQLDDRNIDGTIPANAIKAIIQQEILFALTGSGKG
eukprot:3607444-Ditylum_brightwellii.AAC.1